jgi:hypothetical protein
LNLQVDVGDLRAALLWMAEGALAKLGKPDMPALAQFHPGCDQDAVNIHTGPAFEPKSIFTVPVSMALRLSTQPP